LKTKQACLYSWEACGVIGLLKKRKSLRQAQITRNSTSTSEISGTNTLKPQAALKPVPTIRANSSSMAPIAGVLKSLVQLHAAHEKYGDRLSFFATAARLSIKTVLYGPCP